MSTDVDVRHEIQWRGRYLSVQEYERLAEIGESAFEAEILNLPRELIDLFLACRGTIDCCAQTKRGRPCRNTVVMFGQFFGLDNDSLLYHHDNPAPAIREWLKLREIGIRCFSHGGERGIVQWSAYDGAYRRPEVAAQERATAEESRESRRETRLARDAENPRDPSWTLLGKIGRVAVEQFDRLEPGRIQDPEVREWLRRMHERSLNP